MAHSLATTHSVADLLAPVVGAEGQFLSAGTGAEGHVALADVDGSVLSRWLAEEARHDAGMDGRTEAAYLIGDVGYAVGLNLGALHLSGRGVPALCAEEVALRPSWYHWAVNGRTGESMRFELRLLVSGNERRPVLDTAGFRRLIEALHTPLIERLHAASRLGRSAMWRLVADGITAGMLAVGKRTGHETEAMAEALAIVTARGSPLANKQVGFVEIVATAADDPDKVVGCEWFRTRGGCCRYYMTNASQGEYCSTCVLRSPDSRDSVLIDYLRRKAAAA